MGRRNSYLVRATVAVVTATTLLIPAEAMANHDEFVDKSNRFPTELISVTSAETQDKDDLQLTGDCKGSGNLGSVSDGGRYVAFETHAKLDPADVNGNLLSDIYVRDRKKGTTELVSVTAEGLAPPDRLPGLPTVKCLSMSISPSISGNGRYVAFASRAALTGGEQLPYSDTVGLNVYVRDLKKDTTELATPAVDNQPSLGNSGTTNTSISDDGRFVTFSSNAGNLVETDTCPQSPLRLVCPFHIFVRDLVQDETKLLSVTPNGEPGNNGSGNPYISDNGGVVVFDSYASDLVDNDLAVCANLTTTTCMDVFVYDLSKDRVELISVNRDGTSSADQTSTVSVVDMPSQQLSGDGRFVLFKSSASNLVPAGLEGTYVRDRQEDRTERVSVTSVGRETNGIRASISDDGRFVHLVGDVCDPLHDLTAACDEHEYASDSSYLFDRRTGQLDYLGPPDRTGAAVDVFLEGTSRYIAFSSADEDLAEGDSNQTYDVMTRPLGTPRLGVDPRNAEELKTSGERAAAVVELVDATGDAVLNEGEIVGASLAYRPELGDLFARIDLERLPVLSGTGLLEVPTLYKMEFDAGGAHYKVRIAGSTTGLGLITTPIFALSRCSGEVCTEIARLRGGYGTTGESVVASIPLGVLGTAGGTITNVKASSALGSYLTGEGQLLDRVTG